MKAWLGLPEEDGCFAFILRFTQGNYRFIALGRTSEPPQIIVDEGQFSLEEQNVHEVPTTLAAAILRRAFHGESAEEWLLLDTLLPPSESLSPLPEFDSQYAKPTLKLRNPQMGAYMSFNEEHLKDALAAIVLAVKNPQAHKAIIDAAVDTLANLALTLSKRARWQLALELIAALARMRLEDNLAQCALHNAAGIAQGKEGSAIPFVRDWAEHTLQSAAALARVVEKANQKSQEA